MIANSGKFTYKEPLMKLSIVQKPVLVKNAMPDVG